MKNKFFKIITSLIILISPSLIIAEGEDFALITPPVEIYDKGLIGFLEIIISGITLLAVPIIVLAFVYSGFMFVFATGNSDKLQKAKTTFWMTVVGSTIILGSNLALQLVEGTTEEILALI